MSRAEKEPTDGTTPSPLLTVPNALCLFRLGAAPALVALAWHERRIEVTVLFVAMALSDWLDGKIAVHFDQRSAIGPMLDSVADLAMYLALAVSIPLLEPEIVGPAVVWLSAVAGSYLVAGFSSMLKFRRWPSHHTAIAKGSWLLALIGAVVLLLTGNTLTMRAAMIGGMLANVLSIAITSILPEYHTDVPTLQRALRIRRGEEESGSG